MTPQSSHYIIAVLTFIFFWYRMRTFYQKKPLVKSVHRYYLVTWEQLLQMYRLEQRIYILCSNCVKTEAHNTIRNTLWWYKNFSYPGQLQLGTLLV